MAAFQGGIGEKRKGRAVGKWVFLSLLDGFITIKTDGLKDASAVINESVACLWLLFWHALRAVLTLAPEMRRVGESVRKLRQKRLR